MTYKGKNLFFCYNTIGMGELLKQIQADNNGKVPAAVDIDQYWNGGDLLDPELVAQTFKTALASDRKRVILRVHKGNEAVVRLMMNALTAETYVPPHKHDYELQRETFRIVRGHADVVLFKENGEINRVVELSGEPDGRKIVTIHPGEIHTVIPHEGGFVMLERTRAPETGYDPKTDKTLPPWALTEPRAGEENYAEKMEQVQNYQRDVKARAAKWKSGKI
jgi:cupin fold WbuC family metalloprotein